MLSYYVDYSTSYLPVAQLLRMRRFFIEPQAVTKDYGRVRGKEAKHIIKVLRLRAGERIELFNGRGRVYQAEIIQLQQKEVKVKILASNSEAGQVATNLTLIQGLLKGKKMDFLIQKATELGVHHFHPVRTRFSENRGNREQQLKRWQRIIFAACKQCNRAKPMAIHPVTGLLDIVTNTYSLKIMLWEGENKQNFADLITPAHDTTCLLIGPEGGFHHSEVALARQAGFITGSLGLRPLRAETAAMAAVSVAQFLLNGLRPAAH